MVSNVSDPPVIGLTTYLERSRTGVWDVRASFLPENYLQSVTRVGGVALLLPPQDPAAASVTLDRVDGLLLTGGIDVDPALYGAQAHPETDAPRTDRDAWELALFREAERRGLPVLAICRGLQLVNVARGGTLHQHLPESLGTERYRLGGGVFARNDVTVEAGSALAGIIGIDPITVDSYHHQGVDAVGAGLRVTATAGDGLPQALEGDGDGYLVAVQWHPEQNAADGRLFADLVREADTYARERRERIPR